MEQNWPVISLTLFCVADHWREINKMQCNVLNNFIQSMLHNFMFASQYYKILHASLRCCYLESVRHTASTAHAEGETSAAAIREEVF